MAQYGFCGGAAKPANTFYLFWQWARPEGCGILCSPAPRRAGRTLLVPRGAGQTAPSRNQSLVQWPRPQILVLRHRGQVGAGQSTAGGEGEGHLGAKIRIPDPKGGNKAAGRARMLTQSSRTRLEQPQEPPRHRFL